MGWHLLEARRLDRFLHDLDERREPLSTTTSAAPTPSESQCTTAPHQLLDFGFELAETAQKASRRSGPEIRHMHADDNLLIEAFALFGHEGLAIAAGTGAPTANSNPTTMLSYESG